MEPGKKRVRGRPPSTDEQFYLEWGYETLKNNFNLLNEVLRQLLTLDAALLAAAIGFLDKIKIPDWSKAFVLILLCASLVISFLGVLPYKGKVDLRKPEDIKLHKEKALASKRRFLWIAASLLFVSFVISILGLLASTTPCLFGNPLDLPPDPGYLPAKSPLDCEIFVEKLGKLVLRGRPYWEVTL